MGGEPAIELLRTGLLEGTAVLVAGPPAESALGAAVCDACTGRGAAVSTCCSDSTDEAALDAAVSAVVKEAGGIDVLAVDGAGIFADGLGARGDGHAALRACMDAAWNATRAVINIAFLPVEPTPPTRRIVYLAPSGDADRSEVGGYAEAACAGLENLARTLSIEWARHGINTVTIAPGAETSAEEVGALVAYLASPAGAYFSGCLLDLRGP